MRAAARFALSLYPAAWRRRYGDEMEALLEEGGGASASAVVDLLRGAAAAHLRRGAGAGIALLWWALFVLAGLGFYKTTENFEALGDAHSALGASHLAVQVAAGAAAVVSLVALWLLWRARSDDEREARRRAGEVRAAAGLLTVAMAAGALAVGVYSVALLADAGEAAAEPNGPGGLVSVGLSLAIQFAVMAAATALCARGVRRAAASPPPAPGPSACR